MIEVKREGIILSKTDFEFENEAINLGEKLKKENKLIWSIFYVHTPCIGYEISERMY